MIFVANAISTDELIPLLVEASFGIEIQGFCDPRRLDDVPYRQEVRELISPLAHRSVHGPFSDLVPVSRDPEIRRVTRERFEAAYQITRDLQAEHLVLHSGFIPKTYLPDYWLQSATGFWKSFLSDKPGSIQVHVENIYEDRFDLLRELVDQVDHPCFSLCLDVGHVNANSSHSLEEWISALQHRIGYVHLHNNGGIYDDHWGLWQGQIDMPGVLELLGRLAPKADWSIETIGRDVVGSIEWLQRILPSLHR